MSHYFDATPQSRERRREVAVGIGGRERIVTTSSGVFSGDGLDHATAVLLHELAASSATPKRVLDLGCGWGPIALAVGLQYPHAEVWAVDVNVRALELTSLNAECHGVNVRTALPEDVPDDVLFDEIWTNPPIRIGKQPLHDLLLRWLNRLSADGTMTMVVGKNLGADSLQRWLIEQHWPTDRITSSKGFRILRTRRP